MHRFKAGGEDFGVETTFNFSLFSTLHKQLCHEP